jgi:hypothetical protein
VLFLQKVNLISIENNKQRNGNDSHGKDEVEHTFFIRIMTTEFLKNDMINEVDNGETIQQDHQQERMVFSEVAHIDNVNGPNCDKSVKCYRLGKGRIKVIALEEICNRND